VLGERECQSVICSNVPGLGAIKSLAVLSIDHVAVSSFSPLGGGVVSSCNMWQSICTHWSTPACWQELMKNRVELMRGRVDEERW